MKSFRLTAAVTPLLIAIALMLPSGNASATPATPSHATSAAAAKAPSVTPLHVAHPRGGTAGTPTGFTPAQLVKAYGLRSASQTASTIGISIAFHSSTLVHDVNVQIAMDNVATLAAWRTYHDRGELPNLLPLLHKCTTATQRGCLDVRNAYGKAYNFPVSDFGWGMEETLDVFAAYGFSPHSRILVSEANYAEYDGSGNLGTTLTTLARLCAKVVNMSWGSNEYDGEQAFAKTYLSNPHIRYVVASGDGSFGSSFPGTAPGVISVGGTTLQLTPHGHRASETVWIGTAGACSFFFAKPRDQRGTLCGAMKYQNDIAADADPATGLALFYQGYEYEVGGTSLSAPFITAAYALAGSGNIRPQNGRNLYDVTVGSDDLCTVQDCSSPSNGAAKSGAAQSGGGNVTPAASPQGGTGGGGAFDPCTVKRQCTAGPGLDGPSGWGTLNGLQALKAS